MEVFRAVMLTGSINGASKMLFISQPVVSRMIAHAEQILGYALFTRTKGKLVPTPEGEALFREVDDFYQHASRVNQFAADLARGPAGTLKITSSPCLSYQLLPRAISLFMERYPHIRVSYHTSLMGTMPDEVLSNKVDLAVSVLPLEHPNLRVNTFSEGRMVCVVPEHHDLAARERLSCGDLMSTSLITHDPSIFFGKLVRATFERLGYELAPRIYVKQTEIACSLVRAGVGVAIVDEYTAIGVPWTGLVVRPLEENIVLAPTIACTSFDRLGTHADKFAEILVQQSGRVQSLHR